MASKAKPKRVSLRTLETGETVYFLCKQASSPRQRWAVARFVLSPRYTRSSTSSLIRHVIVLLCSSSTAALEARAMLKVHGWVLSSSQRNTRSNSQFTAGTTSQGILTLNRGLNHVIILSPHVIQPIVYSSSSKVSTKATNCPYNILHVFFAWRASVALKATVGARQRRSDTCRLSLLFGDLKASRPLLFMRRRPSKQAAK